MTYIFIILFVLYIMTIKRPLHIIKIYFGVPGSGKTTYLAYLYKKANKQSKIITWCEKHHNKWISKIIIKSRLFKRRRKVFSNVPVTGAYQLNVAEDIGIHMIEDALVLIDEAGIEYNSRNFKNFPQEAIYWWKYHRHYKTEVCVFSQSYDDMDITIKRLSQKYFVIKKSLFPNCIVLKPIRRSIGIDKLTHQIADMYDFDLPILSYKWIYCPPLWKLFNSYSRKELIPYEFKKW